MHASQANHSQDMLQEETTEMSQPPKTELEEADNVQLHRQLNEAPGATHNVEKTHPENRDTNKSGPQPKTKLPSVFSRQLKPDRIELLKSIARVEVLLVAIILGILSIYWGALASMLPNQDVLTVAIVDFDGQEIGNAFTQFALTQRQQAEKNDEPVLGYISQPASMYNNEPAMLEAALRNEKMWVAISVQPYASEVMNYAYQNGNQSYDPSDAIHVIYQEARNALVSDEFIQPFLRDLLDEFVQTFAKRKSQELASASFNNLTALQNALSVSIPASFTMINLNPFLPIVGEAATQIGLIYLVIVAFFGVLFFMPVHFQFMGRIPTGQYYAYRLLLPLCSYFFLSLLYTVLSVIWGIDFNTYYGHAGFVIYWMLSFVSMLALGLPVENIHNTFGPPWMQIFLILWVISNVTVGFFPNELLSNFYKWGLAWPFYHIVKASATLIFGTKNWLGLNFGVLLTWAVVSYALLPHSVWVETKKHKQAFAKNRREARERLQKADIATEDV